MMPWFGEPWPGVNYRAEACRDDRFRVPTPIGQFCFLCEWPILHGDRGQLMAGLGANMELVGPMPAHIECLCRNVTGCSDLYMSGEMWQPGHVCGGAASYREDALLVWGADARATAVPQMTGEAELRARLWRMVNHWRTMPNGAEFSDLLAQVLRSTRGVPFGTPNDDDHDR